MVVMMSMVVNARSDDGDGESGGCDDAAASSATGTIAVTLAFAPVLFICRPRYLTL